MDIHQVRPLTAVQIGGPTHVLPLLALGDVPTILNIVLILFNGIVCLSSV